MKWMCRALSTVLLIGVSTIAAAQTYPDKPIRVLVPFAAGSGTDILARIVTDELRTSMGANFVIDNRAGASGQIAAELVAKANADGYTLFLSTNTPHSANPFLFKKLAYDPVKDYASVSRMIYFVFILVVHPNSGIKTVPDLIAYVKANPGKTSYAFGNSTGQVNGAFFVSAAKLDSLAVPYKSTPSAMTDLIAGQVQFMFATASSVIPQVRSGRLRALAVTSAHRSRTLPDLPTVEEAGVPRFEATTWHGVVVPAATAPAIVKTINAAINSALSADDVKERLSAQGAETQGGTSSEFAAYLRNEIPKWTQVVRESGAKPE